MISVKSGLGFAEVEHNGVAHVATVPRLGFEEGINPRGSSWPMRQLGIWALLLAWLGYAQCPMCGMVGRRVVEWTLGPPRVDS